MKDAVFNRVLHNEIDFLMLTLTLKQLIKKNEIND